jgi:ATP-dependent HslUV protease ATP-binding subunit HslU
LLEQISFEGPELPEKKVVIDARYVDQRLKDIVKDQDLSRYIL